MKKLTQTLNKIKQVFLKYPIVLAVALTLGVLLWILVDNHTDEVYKILALATTSGLGISLFFGIKMLSQRVGRSILWHILGLLILVGFYFAFPKNEKDMSEIELFWIIPNFILSHLLVAFAPFLTKKNEIKFWEYNKNLFVNFILTILFSGVLIGGIELAILAVQELFSIDLNERIYPKTFFFLSTFGSCFIFLTFNEGGLPYLEQKREYPIVLKFFTQFILIPLLLIYAVILYLYSGKILIQWELPRGWVSYLILAYALVGILALLLVHPLKNEGAKSWVKIFSRVFYYALIPLLALLYVAIFTRILEYGYTEARYFVLLISIWLSSVVLYFVFIKRATIKFIPISLFCFGLFALLIPYFNAFSVAKRSQKSELMRVFKENKLLKNGKIDFNAKISEEVVRNIESKVRFFKQRKSVDFILNLVDKKTKDELSTKNSDYYFAYDFRLKFKNVTYSDKEEEIYTTIRLENKKTNFNIKNYDYLFHYNDNNNYQPNIFKINEDELKFIFKEGYYSTKFEIILNDKTKVDLFPQIQALFKPYLAYTGYYTKELPEISFLVSIEGYELKIYFENMIYTKDGKNYKFNNAMILVKEK